MGVTPIQEALRIAQARDLDLVEVAPSAVPPVCKVMDYGKYKYQLGKRHAARKTVSVKEIKIRLRIDDHDLERKAKSVRSFLDDGNKTKVSMFFRGRERGKPELGMKVFEKMIQILTGKFNIEQPPRHEGNSITMIVTPK